MGKMGIKHFLIFAVLAYILFWLGGIFVAWIPALGNPWIDAAFAFIVLIIPFYIVWMKWGAKQASEV